MAITLNTYSDQLTAAEWASDNPTLRFGEMARDSDTGRIKFGDGTTAWSSLPYVDQMAGAGTVTSVAMTLPSFLSVSGSPITTSGTLAVTLANQNANLVFAGPGSGSAATPTFRALVALDIPNLDAAKITSGTIATARLGSGTANSSTFLRGDQTWATGTSSVAFNNITSGTNTSASMIVDTTAQIRFDTLTACLFKDPLGSSGTRTCAICYQPAGSGDYGFTATLPSITGIFIMDEDAQNINGVKTFTVRPTFGDGFKVTEGTDEAMGAATLVGGTVTVNTGKVTANSRIFLTGQNSSGTHGELTVSARSVGTSFTITSSSGSDTRSVAWLLVEPS